MACASRVGGAKRDDKEMTLSFRQLVGFKQQLNWKILVSISMYIYIHMYIHIHTVTRRPWRCTFQDFAKNSLGVVKLSKKRHAFFPWSFELLGLSKHRHMTGRLLNVSLFNIVPMLGCFQVHSLVNLRPNIGSGYAVRGSNERLGWSRM